MIKTSAISVFVYFVNYKVTYLLFANYKFSLLWSACVIVSAETLHVVRRIMDDRAKHIPFDFEEVDEKDQ